MGKAFYFVNDGDMWSSPRANAAYDNGLVPISKLPLKLRNFVKSNNIEADEWHHTGKFACRTNFYDVSRIQSLYDSSLVSNTGGIL